MRSVVAALSVLLLSCGGNQAPAVQPVAKPQAKPEVEAKPAPPPKGPFLYKYAGKNGPVYLLGTIHMMVSAKDDLDPIVWNSFASCKKLVLELDPTDPAVFGAITKMFNAGGPGLKSQLTEDEWAKLTSIVKQLPPAALDKLQPWAAGMFLEVASVTDTSKAMEMELVTHAKANEYTIGALETVDDQINALASSSSIEDLKKAIAEYSDIEHALAGLVEAYKAGDLEAFEKAFTSSDENTDPEKMDKLLKERNEKWVPQIEAMLAGEGDVFIAVGAGHLYGEHGLLKLLEARGHTAERLIGGGPKVEGKSQPQAFYFGAMRSAPSSRMTSPLR